MRAPEEGGQTQRWMNEEDTATSDTPIPGPRGPLKEARWVGARVNQPQRCLKLTEYLQAKTIKQNTFVLLGFGNF